MRTLYTSYYGNLRRLVGYPKFAPIAISTSCPVSGIPVYPQLAPGWSLVNGIKTGSINWEQYCTGYYGVLSTLNPNDVVGQLFDLAEEHYGSGELFPVLLCYERPEYHCHRHLVADWLNDAGYLVKEMWGI